MIKTSHRRHSTYLSRLSQRFQENRIDIAESAAITVGATVATGGIGYIACKMVNVIAEKILLNANWSPVIRFSLGAPAELIVAGLCLVGCLSAGFYAWRGASNFITFSSDTLAGTKFVTDRNYDYDF